MQRRRSVNPPAVTCPLGRLPPLYPSRLQFAPRPHHSPERNPGCTAGARPHGGRRRGRLTILLSPAVHTRRRRDESRALGAERPSSVGPPERREGETPPGGKPHEGKTAGRRDLGWEPRGPELRAGPRLRAPSPNPVQHSPGCSGRVRPGSGSPGPGGEGWTGTRLPRIPSQAAGPPLVQGQGPGPVTGTPEPSTPSPDRRLRRHGQEGVAAPLRGGHRWRLQGGAVLAGICRREPDPGTLGPWASQCTSGFVGGSGPEDGRPREARAPWSRN